MLAEGNWLVDRYRVRFDSARSGKERNSGPERCTVSAYSFVLVRSSGHQRFDWEHRAAGSHSRCTLAEARRIHVPVDSWPSFARQFARQFDLLPKALVVAGPMGWLAVAGRSPFVLFAVPIVVVRRVVLGDRGFRGRVQSFSWCRREFQRD